MGIGLWCFSFLRAVLNVCLEFIAAGDLARTPASSGR
jgi:hypothetical protein